MTGSNLSFSHQHRVKEKLYMCVKGDQSKDHIPFKQMFSSTNYNRPALRTGVNSIIKPLQNV